MNDIGRRFCAAFVHFILLITDRRMEIRFD